MINMVHIRGYVLYCTFNPLNRNGVKMALMDKGKGAIQEFVDNGTEFDHGSLSGRSYESWDLVPKGRLDNHPDIINYNDLWRNRPVKVLYSYRTPIAWKFDGDREWFVPEIHHSVTTTNHQNVTRVAIDNPGFYRKTQCTCQ